MARPDEPVLWRGMTRPELDVAYNNSATVPDSAAIVAEWTARSATVREQHPEGLDRRYGPRQRNRIDLFRSGARDAPLLAFIHGGYWQRNSKESFAFLAAGPMAHGFDVAMIGYTLAPDVPFSEIVAETREAVRWLRQEGPAHGVGTGPLTVSGWSAGGHLTACTMDMAEVDAGLPISGVFDIEPCRLNYLNEKLHLTEQEVEAHSPIRHLPAKAGPLLVAYGGDELPELQRQSRDYGEAWIAAGLTGKVEGLPDHDHFSILEELASPDGRLTRQLVGLREALPARP